MSYEEFVAKRTKKSTDIYGSLSPAKANLIHAALLLSGEVGELVDCIKKHAVYGQELDRENLVEEMGDIEFGLAMLRNQLYMSRETILAVNESKLSKRYPNGYSDSKAKERADKQEEVEEEVGDGIKNYRKLKAKIKELVEAPDRVIDLFDNRDFTVRFLVLGVDDSYIVLSSVVHGMEDTVNSDSIPNLGLSALMNSLVHTIPEVKLAISEALKYDDSLHCGITCTTEHTSFFIEEKEED